MGTPKIIHEGASESDVAAAALRRRVDSNEWLLALKLSGERGRNLYDPLPAGFVLAHLCS